MKTRRCPFVLACWVVLCAAAGSAHEQPHDTGPEPIRPQVEILEEANTGFGWPLVNVFSNNGGYTFLQEGDYSGGTVFHPGEDWNVPTSPGGPCDGDQGLAVVAAANGSVVYANGSVWGGIVIQHDYQGITWYTQYGHVENITISMGQTVTKGQQIATIGDVGTDCSHLHFEVREADHPNPTYGPYWTYGSNGLYNTANVNNWYEDPDLFISSHPAYDTQVTCSWEMSTNGGEYMDLSQGWHMWRSGSVSYTVRLGLGDFSGNYSIWLEDGQTGQTWLIMGNQSAAVRTFAFGPPETLTNGGMHRFIVAAQGQPDNEWCSSPTWYTGNLPTISLDLSPLPLVIGQNATASWSISGGIPGRPNGGWMGNVRLQWYQNGNGLVNLTSGTPVANGSYGFTVPANISGASLPGCNLQLRALNADAGTTMPSAVVTDFSSSFCIDGLPVCSVSTSNLDFGTTDPGVAVNRSFTISNTGEGTLSGTVTEACSAFSITDGATYSLGSGESQTVAVRLMSSTAGNHSCTIETGNPCNTDIWCSGSVADPPDCALSTTDLVFPATVPGVPVQASFSISNTGGGTLSGMVTESCGAFSILSGATYSLGSGQSQTVTMQFQSNTPGEHECTIDPGTPCSGPVAGTATVVQVPECQVSPQALDFGTTEVGDPVSRQFTITNTGGGTLSGTVSTGSTHFVIQGQTSYSLVQNQFRTFTVEMVASAQGTHTGTIDTGTACVADVSCSGTVVLPPCAIEVSAPVAGSEVPAGSTLFIQWSGQSISPQVAVYLIRNQLVHHLGTFNSSANGGTATATLPASLVPGFWQVSVVHNGDPECNGSSGSFSVLSGNSTTFHFDPVHATSQAHQITVDNPRVNGVPLPVGGELAVFDGDLCVGATVRLNTEAVSLTAYGQVGSNAGFLSGNDFQLRLWSAASGECIGTLVEIDGPAVFTVDGYTHILTANGSDCTTGLDDPEMPQGFAVLAPYPNPFNPQVTLPVRLARSSRVSLDIFNAQGERVERQVREWAPGSHGFTWNGDGHPSGLYLVRISDGQHTAVRKALLVK